MLKRYILFTGDQYYASGGIDDLADSFDELGEASTEAKKLINDPDYQWAHIYDQKLGMRLEIHGISP